MNLQELQNEERQLVEILSNNRSKQREIYTDEFLYHHGIKIGDTIEFMDGKETVPGLETVRAFKTPGLSFLKGFLGQPEWIQWLIQL